jgi:Low psii accumulation1 / Rep27
MQFPIINLTNTKMTKEAIPEQNIKPTIAEKTKLQDPEKYARLKAEAKAPYRGLRKFIYVSLGAWGGIGAFVFLTALLAGKGEFGANMSNLALQIGLVAFMVLLFRRDR